MAKKHSFGGMLFFGAVSAVVGGVVAYHHREEIDKIVKDMAEKLDASEDEDGFFTVDLSGSSRIGEDAEDDKPKAETSTPTTGSDGEPDSDFVDLHGDSQAENTAESHGPETAE